MGAPRYDSSKRSRDYRPRGPPNTIAIPCHHIRICDFLTLQGRPCQVIRITTSAQTGQHRYLGVDLFTKQLHEESSFLSNPSPSVVVQNMLGPVFKQYRVLDIRDDGRVVAMTETGDVKQGLSVLDQANLLSRVRNSYANGRGSVCVLVISDKGHINTLISSTTTDRAQLRFAIDHDIINITIVCDLYTSWQSIQYSLLEPGLPDKL
ncbi:woronin body major protein [Elasticomyces elasticus]|nr:woronin body major protein [Elasticomyces elasticus]KAK5748388.1 woronin body major protein [Elasticomyces elasticus]